MSLPPLSNVFILGGSLSGLMHALTILKHSPPTTIVTILERSPTPLLHNQGAGVVAGAETQEFFDRYACAGREIAVTSQQRLYLDKSGNVIPQSVEDRQQRMTSWDTLYRLLRWRVDGMDAEEYLPERSCTRPENDGPKATYKHGCTVTGLEQVDEKAVRVTWTEGEGSQATTHSATADLVLACDGASSKVRSIVLPSVQRTYAGYVALRGTVPERSLSVSATDVFEEKFAFFHGPGTQILAYLIPGQSGTLQRGERLANWVWYRNYEADSSALEGLMTDSSGKRHHLTLPVDGMADAVWRGLKDSAGVDLPPQFAELVQKTTHPFVQVITDVEPEKNVFFGGRVLLVGDALAGFRPHTAASTSQAAFDALRLGELLDGKVDLEGYGERCLEYAKSVQRHGVEIGERSQFGRHPSSE